MVKDGLTEPMTWQRLKKIPEQMASGEIESRMIPGLTCHLQGDAIRKTVPLLESRAFPVLRLTTHAYRLRTLFHPAM
jgi:hypothetical protein